MGETRAGQPLPARWALLPAIGAYYFDEIPRDLFVRMRLDRNAGGNG